MYCAKLVAIGSEQLLDGLNVVDLGLDNQRSARITELLELVLSKKNGFYAFEGALHVFPWELKGQSNSSIPTLQYWNSPDTWRGDFADATDDLFFFAEDIVGVQFAVQYDEIVTFDPETAAIEPVASTVEGWAERILNDYHLLTAYPLAHSWQQEHGALPIGYRLLPKIPLVLGGGFEQDNMVAVDACKGMQYRADIWRQIASLPDGAQVRLKPLP